VFEGVCLCAWGGFHIQNCNHITIWRCRLQKRLSCQQSHTCFKQTHTDIISASTHTNCCTPPAVKPVFVFVCVCVGGLICKFGDVALKTNLPLVFKPVCMCVSGLCSCVWGGRGWYGDVDLKNGSLQHITTHCNTLQHTATLYNTPASREATVRVLVKMCVSMDKKHVTLYTKLSATLCTSHCNITLYITQHHTLHLHHTATWLSISHNSTP